MRATLARLQVQSRAPTLCRSGALALNSRPAGSIVGERTRLWSQLVSGCRNQLVPERLRTERVEAVTGGLTRTPTAQSTACVVASGWNDSARCTGTIGPTGVWQTDRCENAWLYQVHCTLFVLALASVIATDLQTLEYCYVYR